MNVKYLEKSELSLWDKFVDASPQGFVWDYSWWVESITNNDYKICAIFDDNNTIVAGIVLPLFSRRRAINPNLTQSLGILFQDFGAQNNIRLQKVLTTQKEYTNLIFDFIGDYIREFDIKFHYKYDYWLPLYWKGFQQTTMYTYVIDYSGYVLDEEFKRFSKGHKWILNRVEKKSDLKVIESNDINEYLAESDKTYQRQGVKKPYTNEAVIRLYSLLKEHNMIKIFKIEDSDNRIHAIECYVYNDKEAYYWLGASDASLRDSGGHTYLTWFAIRYFSTRVHTFNFGGSMIEQVEKNFRNFSAMPKQYFRIYKLSDWMMFKRLISKVI